jgi:hypothetical protein
MKHVDLTIAAEHYALPAQPPDLSVQPLIQMAPADGGIALAVSLSREGFLVVQRAKVGSAILTQDGRARIRLLDTVVVRLDELARLIMEGVLADEEAAGGLDAILATAPTAGKPAGLKLV